VAIIQEGKTPPDILYIYHRFDDKAIDTFLSGKLWASSPDKFNDPFDCDLDVVDDYGSDREAFQNKANQILKSMQVSELRIQEILDSIETREDVKKYFLNQVNNANKHYGFCVGYTLPTYNDIKKYSGAFVSVDYDQPQEIHLSKYPAGQILADDKFLEQVFKIKHKDWHYEKEWRFITADNVDVAISLSCQIKEVCFGLRMPKWQEESIVHLLRNKSGIEFYKMTRKTGQWDVVPEPYKLK